jgi:hypothetical protein
MSIINEDGVTLISAERDGRINRSGPPACTIEGALRACDWIPWTGGPCPVDENSFLQVLTAGGEIDCERASDFDWEGDDKYPHDRIIAYRVIA